MPPQIEVLTGARLHFGLLAVKAPTGRNFGGVGLMVEAPGCAISVQPSEQDECHAPPDDVVRLVAWREMYRERCPASYRPRACRIELLRALPSHAGLGSGTQTALALAAGLARFAGEPRVPAPELARRVGRGARSALGIHGFEHGGLLVEAGKHKSEEISPLVARLDMPSDWRVVLVTPHARRGLSGEPEKSAFAQLDPMPRSLTDQLCRIVLMELLPAVQSRDFAATAVALREFGRLNGSHFAPVQGGILSDSQMAALARSLEDSGVVGVGQSSWGPTLWVLCPSERSAVEIRQQIGRHPAADACTILVTTPKNVGATIREIPSST
jgi:beta-RFAP synthase